MKLDHAVLTRARWLRQAALVLLVLFALSLLVGTVANAAGYDLFGQVIGAGGSRATGSGYSLGATLGQPMVGRAAGSPLELCSGFWCGTGAGRRLRLPLVLKAYPS